MGRIHPSAALIAALIALLGVKTAAAEGAARNGGYGSGGYGGSSGANSGGVGSGSNCGCSTTPKTNNNNANGSSQTSSTSGGVGAASSVSYSSISSNISVSLSTSASSSSASSGAGTVNTQALLNEAASGGGGGGGWTETGGVTTTIDSIRVEEPATRRICAALKSETRMIVIQAVCLDDKDVPHPASQVRPERTVEDGYEGEVYRCIAGARMQYTLADASARLTFDHGETLTCQKGEALYHSAAGVLACRPQKPARDCNERSLLRRYGAGVKVMKAVRQGVCVAWRTETVQADASR